MLYILFPIVFILAGFFAFRYYKLIYGIHRICKELQEVQQDLTQNQVLHLPIPDKFLSKLLISINTLLKGIQSERQLYEKREKNFQRQIENISHDLRTPLTVILGYLNLLEKNQRNYLQKNEEVAETVTIIKQKSETMKTLITQFYDYSRLSADDYKIDLCTIDVSRILRESLLENYQLLEQHTLQIHADIPEQPILVLGEESSLNRIFQNLFQNVGRYADSTLQIAVKKESDSTIISFTNDTRMLTKDDVSHLFERFYKQDLSRVEGGTGLGLTVAKALAEEMKATLKATVVDTSDSEKLVICFELTLKSL